MNHWAKKIEVLRLYQQSNIPYIYKKDGIFLCFNNFFTTRKTKTSETYNIEFDCHSNILSKIHEQNYQINVFPIIIPVKNIITKINLDTLNTEMISDIKRIALVNDKLLEKTKYFNDLVDELLEFDQVFILVKNAEHLEQIENFSFIYHENWYTTCIQISDAMCEIKDRNCLWTSMVPKLEINCFGLKNPKIIENINNVFDELEIEIQTSCN